MRVWLISVSTPPHVRLTNYCNIFRRWKWLTEDSDSIWEDFLVAKCSVLVLITAQYKGHLDVITPTNKFDLSFLSLLLSVKMLRAVLLICSYDSLTYSFERDDHGAKYWLDHLSLGTVELLKSIISQKEIMWNGPTSCCIILCAD